MQPQTPGSLLVVAERLQGGVTALTLELLGLAKTLAAKLDARVSAVAVGGDAATARLLIAHGADEVYRFEAPSEYEGERWVADVAEAVRAARPRCVLISHTSSGADLGPRLATRLKTAIATACVGATAEDGRLLFTRPCHGGNVRETIAIKTMPAVATVKPGVGIVQTDPAREGKVHLLPEPGTQQRTRVIARELESGESTRLEDAKAIVAGGRGLEGPEGFVVLQDLAAELGAAVGSSRVPCDLGWCPHSWQIGLTGKTVTPDVYFAVGISGAGHHMAGCGNAKTIVAINTDPDAAIFKEARFGIVGDYRKVVPALTAAIAALKKSDEIAATNDEPASRG